MHPISKGLHCFCLRSLRATARAHTPSCFTLSSLSFSSLSYLFSLSSLSPLSLSAAVRLASCRFLLLRFSVSSFAPRAQRRWMRVLYVLRLFVYTDTTHIRSTGYEKKKNITFRIMSLSLDTVYAQYNRSLSSLL